MRHIENEKILDQEVDNDFEKSEDDAENEIERLRKEIMKEKDKNKKNKIIMRKQTFHKVKEFQKKEQGCLYNLKCKKQLDLDVSTDDSIDSKDCVEESILFRIMNGKQRQEHLQKKWLAAFNKARAGVHVMRLFGDLQKKIILFGISNQLEFYEKDSKIEKIVLMPEGKFLSIWNLVLILLLIYTAIAQPFLMAFHQIHTGSQEWLDRIIDILFSFDILIIFITAYEENDGSLQHRHNYIARKYIQSWFIYDVVSIFPFHEIGDNIYAFQRLLRLIKLPRLLKQVSIFDILRQINYFKHNESYHRIEKKIKMNTAIFRQIISMMAAIIVAHIFACFWYITARFDDFGPDTWVFRRGILDNEVYQQYMLAYYWSTQTITTLGYGDIPAVTQFEIALSLIWMVVGVAFYSFVVGNFTSILVGNVEIQATISMKMNRLHELARKAQIPFELMIKIINFIENNYQTLHNQEEEANLVKDLPPSLRDEVFSNTYGEIIQTVEYFRNITDSDFLWRILPLLKPVKLEKDDVLYWKGDQSEDIYFIFKGTIRLYSGKGYPFAKYETGSMFGDCDSLLNLPRVCKAIALTHLNILILKVDKNFEKSFVKQEKNLLQMILDARKKRNYHLQLIDKANKREKEAELQKALQAKTALALTGHFDFGIFKKPEEERTSLLSKVKNNIKSAFSRTKQDEESKSQSQARTSETKSNGRTTIKDAVSRRFQRQLKQDNNQNVADFEIEKMSASPASGPRSNYIPMVHNYFKNNLDLNNQISRKSNLVQESPKLNILKNHSSQMDQFYSVFKQPINQSNLAPPINDNTLNKGLMKIDENIEKTIEAQLNDTQKLNQNNGNIKIENVDQEPKLIQIQIPQIVQSSYENILSPIKKSINSKLIGVQKKKISQEIGSNIKKIFSDNGNKGQRFLNSDKLQIIKNGLNKNLIKKQLDEEIKHQFNHNYLGILQGGQNNPNEQLKLDFQYNNLDSNQQDDLNCLSPFMKNKSPLMMGGKSPKTPAQPTLLEKVMQQTFNKVELDQLQSQFNIIKEINMDEEEYRDMSMKPKYSKQIERKRAEFKQASKLGNSGILDISHRSNLSYKNIHSVKKSAKKRYFLRRSRRPLSPSSLMQSKKSMRQRSMETGLKHGKTIKGSARIPNLRNQEGSSALSDSILNTHQSVSDSEIELNLKGSKDEHDKSLSFDITDNQSNNFKNTDFSVKTLQNFKSNNWRQNYLGNQIQIDSTPSKKESNIQEHRRRNFDISAMSVDFSQDKNKRQSRKTSKKNMQFLLSDIMHVDNLVENNNNDQRQGDNYQNKRQKKSLFAFNKKTGQNKSEFKLESNINNNSELEFSSEAIGNILDINLSESKKISCKDELHLSRAKKDIKENKNFSDQYFSVIDLDQSKKATKNVEELKQDQFHLKEDTQYIDDSSSFFQTQEQQQSPRKSDQRSRNFQTSMFPPKRATVSPLMKDTNHLEVKNYGGYSKFMLSNPNQLEEIKLQKQKDKRTTSFKIYVTRPLFHLQIQQNTQNSTLSSGSSIITNRYVSPFSLQRLQRNVNSITNVPQLDKVSEISQQEVCSSSSSQQLIKAQVSLQNNNQLSRNNPDYNLKNGNAQNFQKFSLKSRFYKNPVEEYQSTISDAVSIAIKYSKKKKDAYQVQQQLKKQMETLSPIKIETRLNKFNNQTQEYFTQITQDSQSPLNIGPDQNNQFDFSGALGLLQGRSRVGSNFDLQLDPSLPQYVKQETDNSSYIQPLNIRNVLIEEIYKKFPFELTNELQLINANNPNTINPLQYQDLKYQSLIQQNVQNTHEQLSRNNKFLQTQVYPINNQRDEVGNYQNNLAQEEEVHEELQEYVDEPDMIGLLQFNNDMNHIAMNIFETFTIFDYVDQINKSKHHTLQDIRQQNQTIDLRQENIDRKLDEIEQQLEKLNLLSHLNLDYSDVSIVFRETSF